MKMEEMWMGRGQGEEEGGMVGMQNKLCYLSKKYRNTVLESKHEEHVSLCLWTPSIIVKGMT